MSGTNGTGKERRLWRVLPVMDRENLTYIAQKAEDDGVEGIFCYQCYGPPFIPLAAAAAVTKRLKLASGIAIAAARSPFETAMAARDLDEISQGRFTLGLGSSVPSWINGVFGMQDNVKPIAHMRDTVAAIRHIHEYAHQGKIPPFNGKYFKADFEAFQDVTHPPIKEHMPIWIAAMREKLTRTAVELGDGVIGHPMWSIDWALNHMSPAIEDELVKRGKKRTDIEVSIWPWVLPNSNEKEALNDGRATIAFYAGVPAYESYFAAHGYEGEAKALQKALIEEGFEKAAKRLVSDDMVRTFMAVGEPDKVREQIEPIWDFADSICVMPPIHSLSPEKIMQYTQAIEETFPPDAL